MAVIKAENLILHDVSRCDCCGACVRACPQLVYQQEGRGAPLQIAAPERCFGCLACEEDCPKDALRVHRLAEGQNEAALPRPGEGAEDGATFDLVIVGAGPAGLGCAIRGRLLGLSVVVLERLPSARRAHHPDGGLLFSSPELYQTKPTADGGIEFPDLGVVVPGALVHERLQDFILGGPSGQRTRARGKPFAGIPVVDKDGFVLQLSLRAQALGAKVLYNTRAMRIEPRDERGLRAAKVDSGLTLWGKVVVSAEGITGRLVHQAGVPVNEKKLGWAFAPYGDFPPLKAPKSEAAFLVGEGPAKAGPLLAYYSSGPHATHFSASPIRKSRQPGLTEPMVAFAERVMAQDERIARFLGALPDPMTGRWDGCRVLIRQVPDRMVADGLIAVGDAVTAAGMITSVMAVKTGDLAAQQAALALKQGDTSAAALAGYEQRLRALQMFKGMPWLGRLLMETGTLGDRQDELFNILSKMPLSRMQTGEVWPVVTFYLRILPKLFDKALKPFLMP